MRKEPEAEIRKEPEIEIKNLQTAEMKKKSKDESRKKAVAEKIEEPEVENLDDEPVKPKFVNMAKKLNNGYWYWQWTWWYKANVLSSAWNSMNYKVCKGWNRKRDPRKYRWAEWSEYYYEKEQFEEHLCWKI